MAERLARLAGNVPPRPPMPETLPDPPAQATVENVFEYIAKLAFFDPRRIKTPEGVLKDIRELDLTTASALTGIDVDDKGNIKYRFGSRLPALGLLTQLLKMLDASSGDVKVLDALLEQFKARYAQMEKQIGK
jgi:hypothetical protein